jgi:membrane protein implicated in regulation of membrane protease activity
MPDWVIWVILAAVLAAGEVAASFTFILGPIALAALVPALVAAVGAPMEAQIASFIVASIASLLLIRPIARRHLRTPARIRTGTAALIGERAVVLDRVDADHGQVKIGGEVWTARPYDEDDVYEPGVRVEVVKIQGATALVQE